MTADTRKTHASHLPSPAAGALALLGLALALGCTRANPAFGHSSDLGPSDTSGADETAAEASSAGDGDSDLDTGDGDSTVDAEVGTGDGDGDGDCLECTISLNTTSSCTLEANQGNSFLAKILLEGQVVYALDEVEAGRVIYSGDSNILNAEFTDCPLYQWLGQTGPELPRLASVGSDTLCAGLGNNLAAYPDWSYLGQNLPPQYVTNPAALADDFDIIVYCPLRTQDLPVLMEPATATTLVDYVTLAGGGLYLVGEYAGAGLDEAAFVDINAIAHPLGTSFIQSNLDWGEATGEVAIGCFPG